MVDIRVNEYYTNSDIYETIRRNVKSEVRPRSFSLNSSAIPIDHPIVLRCKDLGLKTYGSPTTSNQAVIPYPSLKIGPGDSARSHGWLLFLSLCIIGRLPYWYPPENDLGGRLTGDR